MSRVPDTLAGLRAALELSKRAQQSGGLLAATDASLAEHVCGLPVACRCLLHFGTAMLSDPDLYSEAIGVQGASSFLKLAVLAARRRPDCLKQAIDLLQAGLAAQGGQAPELSKHFLDACVLLLATSGEQQRAAADDVMSVVDGWKGGADPSLLRHFIFRLLAAAGPPYSPHFAAWLLRLMMSAGVRRGKDFMQGSNAQRLQRFGAACASLRFVPPLAPREAAFAQELASIKL